MDNGQTLKEIVKTVPDLTCFGFGLWAGDQDKPVCEQRRKFAEERRHLLTQEGDFNRARAWIRVNLERQEKINPLCGSYGLKHLAEPEIGYTTNGLWIAAMIAEGFDLQQCGPNGFFNVRTKSIRAAQRRAWQVRR